MFERLTRSLESLLGLSKAEMRGVFVLLLILLVVLMGKIKCSKNKKKTIEVFEKQIDKNVKEP
ncbi:MAG: hypothetical protein II393_02630 [Cytophagales bacterium]|nr:hypothetical protein [Cytophagales bacterium]